MTGCNYSSCTFYLGFEPRPSFNLIGKRDGDLHSNPNHATLLLCGPTQRKHNQILTTYYPIRFIHILNIKSVEVMKPPVRLSPSTGPNDQQYFYHQQYPSVPEAVIPRQL